MGRIDRLKGKGFKPGESGNPNGRPKGSKNFKTLVLKMLENHPDNKDNDAYHPLASQLMKIAFGEKSNTDQKLKAINMLLDRIEGKPYQNVGMTAEINHLRSFEIVASDGAPAEANGQDK